VGKKRMEITIETTRVFVSGGNSWIRAGCEICGGQALMIPVDEAATAARMNLPAVYSRIAAGEVHLGNTPEGSVFVCLNSLLK
jgi:hypothetical protein